MTGRGRIFSHPPRPLLIEKIKSKFFLTTFFVWYNKNHTPIFKDTCEEQKGGGLYVWRIC